MADLITLDTAKIYVNIDVDNSDNDLLLSSLITSSSAVVEAYCDRVFTAADYTEYQDGVGSDTFMTDQYPINSITSIHDDLDRDFTSASLIDSEDYTFYTNEGIVKLLASSSVIGTNLRTVFSYGNRNIKIVYNAGYSAIPDDLQLIVGEIVSKKYKNIIDRRIGMQSITSAGEGFTLTLHDLLPTQKLILDTKYRRRGIN